MKKMTEKDLRRPVGGKNYAFCRCVGDVTIVGEILNFTATDDVICFHFVRCIECKGSHSSETLTYIKGTSKWSYDRKFGGPVSEIPSNHYAFSTIGGDLITITGDFSGHLALKAIELLETHCNTRPVKELAPKENK